MKRCWQNVGLLAMTLIAVCTFAQCARPQEDSINTTTTNVGVTRQGSPAPALQGKAAGEVQPFKPKDEDLKAALLAHPTPEVWLVFSSSTGQGQPQGASPDSNEPTIIKVKLPSESINTITPLWKASLISRYNIDIVGMPDRESYKIQIRNMLNATAKATSELQKMQIDAPDGRRMISYDEAGEIVRFINVSAGEIIEQAKGLKNKRGTLLSTTRHLTTHSTGAESAWISLSTWMLLGIFSRPVNIARGVGWVE